MAKKKGGVKLNFIIGFLCYHRCQHSKKKGGVKLNFIIGFLCYHSWEVKSIFVSVGLYVTPGVNIDGGG